MVKSPFFIAENFLGGRVISGILKEMCISQPTLDKNGHPLKFERILPPTVLAPIGAALTAHIPEIEEKYQADVTNINVLFQQFFENGSKPAEQPFCENSQYSRRKWSKIKPVDLVGYLWLKTYNDRVPLDPNTEVYGGKTELTNFNFSLTPQAGTLVLFPAGPNFLHAISNIFLGEMVQIKVSVTLRRKHGGEWEYDQDEWPNDGSYLNWF